MTTPNDPNQPQGLTPERLASQLFDATLSLAGTQKVDPREAARHVIAFLTEALFYAVTSTKNDVIAFLTETLIYTASAASAGDENARKELLKHIGETIANAPPLPGKAAPAKP